MQTIDLTNNNDDSAIFLPSISSFYVKTLGNVNAIKRPNLPALPNGLQSLDFLQPDNGLFRYRYALYSVGHACLDLEQSREKQDKMLWNRPEDTVVLGDSGGYQIASGVLNFPWESGMKGDATNKMRRQILDWQEHICDLAITMDIPTRAIGNPRAKDINTFHDCFEWTKSNLEWTIENQNMYGVNGHDRTRLLNVIQGLYWEHDSTGVKAWYDGVKQFNDESIHGDRAFRGWAFAGKSVRNIATQLKLLVTMLHEGMLGGRNNWLHILGQTRLTAMVVATDIQRYIRDYTQDPEFTITTDSASAFLAVAKGQGYTNWRFDNSTKNSKFNYQMDSLIDDKALIGKDCAWPFQSTAIGKILRISDICLDPTPTPVQIQNFLDENEKRATRGEPPLDIPREFLEEGSKDKLIKGKRSSWDTFSYALMMNHNVEMMIRTIQEANRIYSVPSTCIENWVPPNIVRFKYETLPFIFTKNGKPRDFRDPKEYVEVMKYIHDHEPGYLDSLLGQNDKHTQQVSDDGLFDFDAVNNVSGEDKDADFVAHEMEGEREDEE